MFLILYDGFELEKIFFKGRAKVNEKKINVYFCSKFENIWTWQYLSCFECKNCNSKRLLYFKSEYTLFNRFTFIVQRKWIYIVIDWALHIFSILFVLLHFGWKEDMGSKIIKRTLVGLMVDTLTIRSTKIFRYDWHS